MIDAGEMPMFFDWMGGFGLLGMLWMFLAVALNVGVVLLIVLGIRWLIRNTGAGSGATSATGGPTTTSTGQDAALAVLRERFARGEIDAAEFAERRRALEEA